MDPKIKEFDKRQQQLDVTCTVLENLKGQHLAVTKSLNMRKVNRLKTQLEEKVKECFHHTAKMTELSS